MGQYSVRHKLSSGNKVVFNRVHTHVHTPSPSLVRLGSFMFPSLVKKTPLSLSRVRGINAKTTQYDPIIIISE